MIIDVANMSRRRMSSCNKTSIDVFNDAVLHAAFFDTVNNMRLKEILTDVTLLVDGEKFPAHRFVLCAFSDYFQTMFTGPMASSSSCIQIHGVSEETMALVLDYMYTATVSITDENVEDLLDASCLFLLNSLRDRCSKFMKDRVDDYNCLQVYCIAKRFSLQTLMESCLGYIAANFQDIVNFPEFKMLSADDLVDIISLGSLSVPDEDFVLEAALNWLKADMLARLQDFPSVLYCVHLPFVSEYFLSRVADLPTFRVQPDIRSIIRSAQSLTLQNWSTQSSNVRLMEPKAWCSPRKCIQCIPSLLAMAGPNIHVFNSELNQWKELAKCKPRHSAGMDVLESSLYIVGGSIEWKRKATGEIFNFDTREWSVMAPMSTARSNFGFVQLLGKFYAVGGYDGDLPLKTAEVFDPISDSWSPIPSLHHARDGACTVSDGERIYVISGYDGRKYLSSVEVYEPGADQWIVDEIAPVNTYRQNAMCAYYEGRIYLIGGYYDDTPVSSVEVYDIASNQWSYVSPLPEARHYAGAAAMHGHIYVSGGWSGHGAPVSSVLVYDIERDLWSEVAHLPTPTMVNSVSVDFPRKLMIRLFNRASDDLGPSPPQTPFSLTPPKF